MLFVFISKCSILYATTTVTTTSNPHSKKHKIYYMPSPVFLFTEKILVTISGVEFFLFSNTSKISFYFEAFCCCYTKSSSIYFNLLIHQPFDTVNFIFSFVMRFLLWSLVIMEIFKFLLMKREKN